MLQDNAQSVCCLRKLVDDSLLQEWQSARSIGLSTAQDNYRATWFVILSIKPVTQIKLVVGVRLIEGIIVEVIDWRREVILGVECLKVDISGTKLVNASDLSPSCVSLIDCL